MKNNFQLYLLIFISIIFLYSNIYAQNKLIKTISTDLKEICNESCDFVKNDIRKLSLLTATTGLLIYKYDEKIRNNFIDKNDHFKNKGLHSLSQTAYWYGGEDKNVIISFAGITGFYLGSGYLFDNNKYKKTAGLVAESFGFTMLFAQMGKIIFGRGRPVYERGSKSFSPFILSGDAQHSMPSGHTSAAFCFATVIAMRSDSYFVKVPAYTLAFGAALQRVESHRHWTSDVIIAGLLGHFIAKTVVNSHTQPKKLMSMNYSVIPQGMNISLSFPL